jgi:hypothetical protein
MNYTKEFIEGYCQALIDTTENIFSELDVKANVYFNELSKNYDVTIIWSEGYDNAKEEELMQYNHFEITNLKNFGFTLLSFLELRLSNLAYDGDYDSKKAEIEFREEQKFESNRGN